jgi:hypothetical protein
MTPAEIIEQYKNLRLSDANEAETRLKVINHIIYDVLGWTHADVKPEERVSEDGATTWADYVLRTGMTAIVVEAKKAGAAFDNVPNIRRALLSSKLVSGSLGEAIIQARDYARKLSIPFAAVTNGNSWVIFPATRTDQVPFKDSSAIIFSNLKSALEDDYTDFFELISRDATINGSLENELLGRIENQIEERRLNRFFTTSFSRISRHSLFTLIEDAVTTAFTEDVISEDPDLLNKCYVRTPERIRFDSRIRMHIAKRTAVTARTPMRPLKPGSSNPIEDVVTSAAGRARPVAILVLGTVGAGKTTFLTHTRSIGAKSHFEPTPGKPYPHWMYIDFRQYSPSQFPIDYIFDKLKDHINNDPFLSDYEQCIKNAYKKDIEALFKGPLFLLGNDQSERSRRISSLLMDDYEKAQPYVEKIIGYASRTSAVFLVIDNVDQFEDEAVQSKIFADAMALGQRLRTNLICAMRESTFLRHRNTPVFDAFDFDPIAIDPPQVQAVLSKRFFLAKQLLEGRSANFTAENGAQMTISNLAVVIDVVQASVLGTEIGNLIEVLATSDIRLALRMTREFLQSGWTAPGKALRIYEAQGHYMMPRHEALRAIMIGNQQVYAEEYSVIGNPFDSRLAKTEAQLLRLYVLTAAVNLSSKASFKYLEGNDIKKALRHIGFGDKITQSILDDLCVQRWIHTLSHTKPTFEANYVVSRLGGYIVRHFITEMMFLENVMMDTFIADRNEWEALRQLTTDIYAQRDTILKIRVRRERVTRFFQYMKTLYAPLRDESVRRGLPVEWCTNPLADAESSFAANLTRVSRSAERNYGTSAEY